MRQEGGCRGGQVDIGRLGQPGSAGGGGGQNRRGAQKARRRTPAARAKSHAGSKPCSPKR